MDMNESVLPVCLWCNTFRSVANELVSYGWLDMKSMNGSRLQSFDQLTWRMSLDGWHIFKKWKSLLVLVGIGTRLCNGTLFAVIFVKQSRYVIIGSIRQHDQYAPMMSCLNQWAPIKLQVLTDDSLVIIYRSGTNRNTLGWPFCNVMALLDWRLRRGAKLSRT